MYNTIDFLCAFLGERKAIAGMEKKKVLFVATVVKTHIMEFHIPYLKMFQEMGWETAVAAKNDYEDPKDCVIPYCDTYHNIPFARIPWKKENIASYRALKKIVDEGNFDIIHCHTPVGAMIARLAAAGARKRGTKVIYTAHGFHFFKGAPLINWLVYFPAEWMLAGLTDVLITLNREDHAFACKYLHPKRIEYVPGVGIDTRRFSVGNTDRLAKRQELGFGESDFLILTVAEMTKNKNHTTVLKAMALLKEKEEYQNMYYLICGRGEQWPNLEAEAKELGISDHVVFLGYRHDVSELCSCSDLFAFMTLREGLPVALMEAMSCGLPTVCQNIRGNNDLIEDGVEGDFIANTPQAVADAFLRMYREPQRRQQMGRAATEKVRRFDETNVHHIMKDIYLSI